jgi:hypothetical protein
VPQEKIIVKYTYPHVKGLPDIDEALAWSGRYETLYLSNCIKYRKTIEVGKHEIKVVFELTKDLL